MIPYRRWLNREERTSLGPCRGEVVDSLLRRKRIAEEMEANVDPSSLTIGWAFAAELAKGACLPSPCLKASLGVRNSGEPSKELLEVQWAVVHDAEAGGMMAEEVSSAEGS